METRKEKESLNGRQGKEKGELEWRAGKEKGEFEWERRERERSV